MLNTDFNSNDVMTTSATEEEARRAVAKAEMMHGWYKECCQYYAENYQRAPAPIVRKEIAEIIKNGMTAECLKAVIDESQNAYRPSWSYCKAILRRCDVFGIRTLADWNADKGRRESARNPALAYQQREYSDEDFGPDFFMDMSKYKDKSGAEKPAPGAAGSSGKFPKWHAEAMNYSQRKYRDEDFKDLYIDLDKFFGEDKEPEKGGAEG